MPHQGSSQQHQCLLLALPFLQVAAQTNFNIYTINEQNCVTGFKSQHELSQCFISHFNPSDSRKINSKNTKAVCNGKHSQKYVSTTSLGKAQNLNTGIVRPILTSHRSPPPQPTSTICRPSNGRAEFASFLQMNICQGESLENQKLQNHVHK